MVTDPPGARVIVDGIGRGTTPVTIRYLAAGEKRVRVAEGRVPGPGANRPPGAGARSHDRRHPAAGCRRSSATRCRSDTAGSMFAARRAGT